MKSIETDGVLVCYPTGRIDSSNAAAFEQELTEALAEHPGAALVLSGILEGQYPRVRAAYEACGMREERTIAIGEWTSGLFRRA